MLVIRTIWKVGGSQRPKRDGSFDISSLQLSAIKMRNEVGLSVHKPLTIVTWYPAECGRQTYNHLPHFRRK
jgi:hypothetical protein